MPLSDQEKTELKSQFAMLEELGEPEALLSAFQRACARKARDRLTPAAEAVRWQAAADGLMEAEAAASARQSPGPRKLAESTAEWAGPQLHARIIGDDAPQDAPIEASQLEKEHGRQGPPEPEPPAEA